METNSSSEHRRLVNIELATRRTNRNIKKIVRNHTPREEQEKLLLDFYCECSDEQCNSRIRMTIEQYERLQLDDSTFIIAPGHQIGAVEKVIHTAPRFSIVEKYALA